MNWDTMQRRLAPVWALAGASAVLSAASMLGRRVGVVGAGLLVVGAFMLLAAILSFKAPERARLLNGLLIGVLGLIIVAQVVALLSSVIARGSKGPLMNLAAIHGLATSALFLWLVFLGLKALKTRGGGHHMLTPRLLGAVLLTSAAKHIFMMTVEAPDSAMFEAALGPLGIKVYGIPGWQAWHVLSVVVALALFLPHLVKRALTVLLVMVVALIPMFVVASASSPSPVFAAPGVMVLGVVTIGSVAYLVWWLREGVPPASSSSAIA